MHPLIRKVHFPSFPCDRMSRNKDKHEGASGRQYRIMSDAERAAGKPGCWTALEVTGGVRALAPQLFRLTHLTELYLNDNSLQRLPPEISQLSALHTLDVSNNKLRSLPVELGDLIQLSRSTTVLLVLPTSTKNNGPSEVTTSGEKRTEGISTQCHCQCHHFDQYYDVKDVLLAELHLNNNYLRVLPYELGKLFHLQLLGLQGNPLSKEMLSIYNDSNGTAKLLSYMLDNLQGKFHVIFIAMRIERELQSFTRISLFGLVR
ncbi:CCR4-NOT transcription complex subunit 6-like [Papilio xuthus]|uniref:CCR4-NOT transcription complex subunit 6-like n=1 Tax=Papilio xuthus TaxID=66420 RepID=A0A194QAD0_PAPXU|nr:CCR4-NOT transcription complex subunit 6-like [Papilio xuthus]